METQQGGAMRVQQNRITFGITAAVAFVLSVVGANYFVTHVGDQPFPGGPHVLPVWPGVSGPSGFVWIGFALTARDVLQRCLGRQATVAAIVLGAALSYFIAPAFAFASGVTFLVAELADFAVFTPLADRNLPGAVVASNIVGAVLDSVLFLWLAFGWSSVATFALPQAWGKLWVSVLFIPVLLFVRSRVEVLPRNAYAELAP